MSKNFLSLALFSLSLSAWSLMPEGQEIKSDLINSEGKKIGTVMLNQERDGVSIVVKAKDLPPGLHGMHFHEFAKCEIPDFKSAGAHFAPDGKPHGLLHPEPQVGTLPNLPVKADGSVEFEVLNPRATLESDKKHSLLRGEGTSLVIHEGADDQYTQDSGKAGGRIACAVIQSPDDEE